MFWQAKPKTAEVMLPPPSLVDAREVIHNTRQMQRLLVSASKLHSAVEMYQDEMVPVGCGLLDAAMGDLAEFRIAPLSRLHSVGGLHAVVQMNTGALFFSLRPEHIHAELDGSLRCTLPEELIVHQWRTEYRVPRQAGDRATVAIAGHDPVAADVLDLSPGGVGVRLHAQHGPFVAGMMLHLELFLEGQALEFRDVSIAHTLAEERQVRLGLALHRENPRYNNLLLARQARLVGD